MADTTRAFQKKLPTAIRKQSIAANKAHKAAYTPKEEAAPPEGAPMPPEGAASPQVVQLATQEAQEPAQAPQAPPATSAPAPTSEQAPERPVAAQEPATDWEQKYRTLQGMINQQGKELKARQAQIDGLQATIAAVTSVQGDDTPATPKSGKERHLRPEDIETYGEDMITVVQRAARDAFAEERTAFQAEIADLKQQVGGVQNQAAQSSVSRVEGFLDEHVPQWKQLNESPEFIAWLAEPDILSGAPRQALMDNACKEFSAPRIAAFFTQYLNESQAIRGHQEAAAPVQNTARQPIVDPTSLVAPGRPAASGTGAGTATDHEEQPRFFTESTIREFYRDVQKGKFRGREKEKEKLERQIHQAANSGRVRSG